MIDEGPSAEDIARFSDDTAHCPNCGAEIWDAAEVCPRCHGYVSGNTVSRHPIERWWRQKWIVLLVIAILIGMGGYVGFRIL